MKKKTLKKEAIEALNRSAGQYDRYGKWSIALFLRDTADRLAGVQVDRLDTWDRKERREV